MRPTIFIAALLLIAWAGPARAETASYSFDSFQEVTIDSTVGSLNNTVIETDSSRVSSITGSYSDDRGIHTLNQASGSLNSQSNIAVINFTEGEGLLEIGEDYLNESSSNTVEISGISRRESAIEGSFTGSRGVFMVNQSSGNLNQQNNVLVFSIGSTAVLGDAELATSTANNIVKEDPDAIVERRDSLSDSFSGATAVAVINQSSGDLNTIRNTLSLSYSVETLK